MHIASVITTTDELTMLGIHLGCDPIRVFLKLDENANNGNNGIFVFTE